MLRYLRRSGFPALACTLHLCSFPFGAPTPGTSPVRSLGVLPSHQEAAAAKDQDHGRDQHHRRERVDGWRDAKPDHRVYLQRQRARPDPGDEERYYEVVERERERQESSGHDAWQDKRERYA